MATMFNAVFSTDRVVLSAKRTNVTVFENTQGLSDDQKYFVETQIFNEKKDGQICFSVEELKLLQEVVEQQNIIKKAINNTLEESLKRVCDKQTENEEFKRTETALEYCNKFGFVMLIYDIPETLNKQCPNPSRDFWGPGFRLNDSCWVFINNDQGISSPVVKKYITHWNRYQGVKSYILPFSDQANETTLKIGAVKLNEELQRAHTSLIKLIASQDEKLQKATEGLDKAQNIRDCVVRNKIRETAKILDNCISWAMRYDDTGDTKDLLEALKLAYETARANFNLEATFRGITLA